MKLNICIVKPAVRLVTPEERFPEMATIIEYAGRKSHKSEDKATDDSAHDFIHRIALGLGHESILEHCVITVDARMSRAASHQWVRHRIAAYCVTGDTVVVAHSKPNRSPKRWTLKQLYDWQDDSKRKGRLKLIRLRSVNPSGQIVPGEIKRVVDTGIQRIFQVRTRCGKKLRCTDNEWFMTAAGWTRLHELSVGSRIKVNGNLAYRDEDWLHHQYLTLNRERSAVAQLAGVSDSCIGKWIKKFGLQKPRTQYPNRRAGHGITGMHGEEDRSRIAERMRGEANHRWKGAEAGDQAGRKRAQAKYDSLLLCDCCDKQAAHRHHLDENPCNNEESNVVPLCSTCHAGHHIGQAVFVVHYTPITSIIACGVERTYDIEMATEDPDLRNYIANGFLVHNTQESQRYCDYSHPKFGKTLEVICPPAIAPAGCKIPSGTVVTANMIGKSDDPHAWEDNEDFEYKLFVPAAKVVDPDATYEQLELSEMGDVFRRWCYAIIRAYGRYIWLREQGIKAEDARFILPNAAKTEIVVTNNIRSWRHFFTMRCTKHAQWEIRGIAKDLLRIFIAKAPWGFDDEQMRKLAE